MLQLPRLREAIWYGNGTKTAYTYDAKTYRLTRLLTTKSSNIYQDLLYWYDPVGNITQIQDDAQQTLYYSGSVVAPDQDFTYDALYRLIIAEGRELIGTATFGSNDNTHDSSWQTSHQGNGAAVQNYTQTYEYDQVGNILELQHSAASGSYTRTYDYDTTSNRLDSTTVGANTYNYTYDNRGNTLTMPHLSVMDWNAQNELQKAGNGTVNTYFNYSSGERIRKVCEKPGSIREERIYLGSYELYRKYVSGSLTLERTTVHISDDTGRIAMLEERTVGSDSAPASLQRYIYSNYLSTASLELDDTAAIISYEEYHPYGTTAYQAMNATINAVAKRYRYTGKERDEETGLYYHGARYYISWLCRWSATDPINNEWYNLGKGNPKKNLERQHVELTASSYEYCYDCPTRFTDPTGEQPPTKEQKPVGEQSYPRSPGTPDNPPKEARGNPYPFLDPKATPKTPPGTSPYQPPKTNPPGPGPKTPLGLAPIVGGVILFIVLLFLSPGGEGKGQDVQHGNPKMWEEQMKRVQDPIETPQPDSQPDDKPQKPDEQPPNKPEEPDKEPEEIRIALSVDKFLKPFSVAVRGRTWENWPIKPSAMTAAAFAVALFVLGTLFPNLTFHMNISAPNGGNIFDAANVAARPNSITLAEFKTVYKFFRNRTTFYEKSGSIFKKVNDIDKRVQKAGFNIN